MTKFEKRVIAVIMAAMMCVPAAGTSVVTVQAEETDGAVQAGDQQVAPDQAGTEAWSAEDGAAAPADAGQPTEETEASEEAQEQEGNDLSDGAFIPLEDETADDETAEEAADQTAAEEEKNIQEQPAKTYVAPEDTAGTITVGGDNVPVKMTTEITDGMAVSYQLKVEETGKYYFHVRGEAVYDVYESTADGEEWKAGSSSRDGALQSTIDLEKGKDYRLDVGYDYVGTNSTVEWEMGLVPTAEGDMETEIFEGGAIAYYRLDPKWDGVYYLESSDSQMSAEIYYGQDQAFYPSTPDGLFKIDPSKETYIGIRYYWDEVQPTGTISWKLTEVEVPEITEGQEIHTVVSSGAMSPVYKFTAPKDGRYTASYLNIKIFGENWENEWSDYETGGMTMTAGQTCYLMFNNYTALETDWTFDLLNEVVIQEGKSYRVASDTYYKFVPEESGRYDTGGYYSMNLDDSSCNQIWDYNLTAGQTYYLTGGRYYFQINKYQEPETEKVTVEIGQSYVTEPDEEIQYTFAPSESGRYRIRTEEKARFTVTGDGSSQSIWGYGNELYVSMEAGETYEIIVQTERGLDVEPYEIHWTFSKAGLTEIQEGKDYTAEAAKAQGYVFVPKTSGYYVLESENTGSSKIYDADWKEILTSENSYNYINEDGFGISVKLEAGKTYYFEINPAEEKAVWHINPVQENSDYWYRTLDDGTVELLKYNGSDAQVQIPGSVDGKTVSCIGYGAFEENSTLESVSVPGSVTALQYGAFDSCENLKTVTFASGSKLESIGHSAFRECGSLAEINLPDTVETMGDYSFYRTAALTDINLASGLTEIGRSAFYQSGLIEVRIPDSVKEIGEFSFAYNKALKKLTLGKGISEITEGAFNGCSQLTEVAFPANVTSIGSSAFGSTGLTAVTIPDTVTSIGSSCFSSCRSLQEVTIGSGVTYIADSAFASCDLRKVTINGKVEKIGTYAFNSNENLESIDLPNTVTEIEYGAFRTCGSLMDIEIPDSVEAIGGSSLDSLKYGGTAWYDSQTDGVVYAGNVLYKYKGTAPEGTKIEVKDGTKGIAGYAFDFQYNLTDITIPNTVTNIGEYALYGCGELTEIHIPETVTEIGRYALGYLNDWDELKVDGFTIYGVSGTAAETYAKENGFTFVAVEPEYELGDVDGDGVVGISDLRLVLRSVCEKVTLSATEKLSADVMKDGKVDIKDLRMILRYVCHKIDSFV